MTADPYTKARTFLTLHERQVPDLVARALAFLDRTAKVEGFPPPLFVFRGRRVTDDTGNDVFDDTKEIEIEYVATGSFSVTFLDPEADLDGDGDGDYCVYAYMTQTGAFSRSLPASEVTDDMLTDLVKALRRMV